MPHDFPHKRPCRNVGPLGESALIVPKLHVLRNANYCKPNAKFVTKSIPGPLKFRVRIEPVPSATTVDTANPSIDTLLQYSL